LRSFFLVGLLASNLVLARDQLFLGVPSVQVGFYVTSTVTAFVPTHARVLKPHCLTTLFTGMKLALLVGFWWWLAGFQTGLWKRTAR
jgi:hypothetical protein